MSVIVLNPPSDDILHVVPLRKAIRMIEREVVEIVEVLDGSMFGPYIVPRTLRLLEPVDILVRTENAVRTFSKHAVLERDLWRCAYCGRTATTVDHVVPRARGGESSWLNLVAACKRCNHRKGDRSLRECGMRLQFLPFEPTAL